MLGSSASSDLDARESTSSGPFAAFRSRPDLRPPAITVHVARPEVTPGMVVTECHAGGGQQGPMIMDGRGKLVWFRPLSDNGSLALRAFNTQVQTYRGKPVLCWFRGAVVQGHGQGYYEMYDTSYRKVAEVHAGNGYVGDLHEFFLTDQGTAIFTCYGRATGNLSSFGGATNGEYFYGVVQEVDVATGQVLSQWRSDEHVELAESLVSAPTSGSAPFDYVHVNSVCIDPADGNLLVSGRNTWAVYKVHRRTGEVLWRLGGARSDFDVAPRAGFSFQHHVVAHSNGTYSIFDNEGGPPNQAPSSRGLIVTVDEAARQVRFQRQFDHRPPVMSEALGSVQELAGGHTFIGWGTSSYFTEYDARGAVLLDGRLGPGVDSYRAFKQPWQARPLEPPTLSLERKRGTTLLYASWNGATDVARWRVLSGSSAHQLGVFGEAERYGFETEITLGRPGRYCAVEALDASGNVLGRSPVRQT